MNRARAASPLIFHRLLGTSTLRPHRTYSLQYGSTPSSTIESDSEKKEPIHNSKPSTNLTSNETLSRELADPNDHQGFRKRKNDGHSVAITNPEKFDKLHNHITDGQTYDVTGQKQMNGPSGYLMHQIRFKAKDGKVIANVIDDNKSHAKPYSLIGPRALHVKVANRHEINVSGNAYVDLVIHEALAGPEASQEMKYQELQRRKTDQTHSDET